MIPEGSRYEEAARAFTASHVYDQYQNPRIDSEDPQALRFRQVFREATYLVTALPLPPVPPAEYYMKDTETIVFLGQKFLQDSTDWWRIAEVNPQIWYPLDVAAGMRIRIPGAAA